MDLITQIMTFLQTHGNLVAIGLLGLLFFKGKINVQGILDWFKTRDPSKPVDLAAILQLLTQLLLKAKAEGRKDDEEAILKVMSSCQSPEE